MSVFTNPETVARYADGPARLVPGLQDLHRMTALLLAERMGDAGKILILGAGGGMELQAFAEWYPAWHFTGVDPSIEMLDLARQRLGALGKRVDLHHGYIDSAPMGPFDGAACLLTLHFVEKPDRLPTLRALRQRLKPGAALVVAHHSFPQTEAQKALWLGRYAAFAISSGVAEDHARRAPAAIGARLPILDPAEEEALLYEAGFADVALFYAGFSFRGWTAINPV